MSQKTTIGLLIALALAVGYVLAYKYNWLGLGRKGPEVSRIGKRLIEKPPADDQIVRVQLSRPDRPTLVAELQGKAWTLVEPASQRADSSKVTDLIAAFKRLKIAAIYAPADKARPGDAVTGLDKPLAVLTMADKSGKSYVLHVGRTALGDKTYVKLDGDANLYAVSGDVMANLARAAEQMRSKSLWDITSDAIRRVELASAEKGKLTLEKKGDDWILTAPRPGALAPVVTLADSGKVSGLLGDLAALTVSEWVNDSPDAAALAMAGLDAPNLTVQMDAEMIVPPATQPELTPLSLNLRIPRQDPSGLGPVASDRVHGRRGDQPALFSLSTATARKLLVGLDDLRDKQVARVRPFDAVELTITPAGCPPTRLIKDAKHQWQVVSADPFKLDSSAVDSYLSKLDGLKAESFEDTPGVLANEALASPRLKVRVGFGEDQPPVELIVGKEVGVKAMLYLKDARSAGVALVRAEDAKDILVDPIALADKSVWTVAEDRVRRISRNGRAGEDARTVERADAFAPWKLTAPAPMDAEADAVRSVLDKFKSVKAVQRTRLTAAQAGLDKPQWTVSLTVLEPPPAPAEPTPSATDPQTVPATQPTTAPQTPPADVEVVHRLKLNVKDDKLYGQSEPAGPVWELDRAILEPVEKEWARLRLIAPDTVNADQVESLTIEAAPADIVKFSRIGADWKLAKDPNVPIDESKVRQVVNDLAGLTVLRYVDFKAANLARHKLDKPTLTVTVQWTGPDGKPASLKLLVAQGPKDPLVTVAGSQVVGALDAAELDKLQKDWKFFEKSKTD